MSALPLRVKVLILIRRTHGLWKHSLSPSVILLAASLTQPFMPFSNTIRCIRGTANTAARKRRNHHSLLSLVSARMIFCCFFVSGSSARSVSFSAPARYLLCRAIGGHKYQATLRNTKCAHAGPQNCSAEHCWVRWWRVQGLAPGIVWCSIPQEPAAQLTTVASTRFGK